MTQPESGWPVTPGCSPHQWVHTDPSRAEEDLDDAWILAGGIYDVRLFIYYLFGASGTPRELDDESIDGSLARHYSTTLDLQKAHDVAPTDIRSVLTADLAEMREVGVRTEVPADIWIDGSGLVRQTVFLFSFEDGTRVRVTTAYSESDLRCGMSQTQQSSASARTGWAWVGVGKTTSASISSTRDQVNRWSTVVTAGGQPQRIRPADRRRDGSPPAAADSDPVPRPVDARPRRRAPRS